MSKSTQQIPTMCHHGCAQGAYNLVRKTKSAYLNKEQYLTAVKNQMENDQVPKNMEQVINAKCNQERGYSSLAGIT